MEKPNAFLARAMAIGAMLGAGLCVGGAPGTAAKSARRGMPYPVVDTGQSQCFGTRLSIPCPRPGQPKADSGKPMNWQQGLRYAETLDLAGHDDWRLPNVRELQSIVDYGKAPDAMDPTRRGPAIDAVFAVTTPESWFWTSTTHLETGFAYYVCFGQASSARRVQGQQINAHGAGAVRSAPKHGPNRWPRGLGPQGDEVRTENYVRCVRGGTKSVLDRTE